MAKFPDVIGQKWTWVSVLAMVVSVAAAGVTVGITFSGPPPHPTGQAFGPKMAAEFSPPPTSTTLPPSTTTTTSEPTSGVVAAPGAQAPVDNPPPPTSTTTTTTTTTTTPQLVVIGPPEPPPIGPGTAELTYSGVLSGQLEDAVSYCQPRPGNESSEIDVNGTLNGTPWALLLVGYVGGTGEEAYSVITGQAGGGTGLSGTPWAAYGNYPVPPAGVTQVDWFHGATLDDVQMAVEGTQGPPYLMVTGTIACG